MDGDDTLPIYHGAGTRQPLTYYATHQQPLDSSTYAHSNGGPPRQTQPLPPPLNPAAHSSASMNHLSRSVSMSNNARRTQEDGDRGYPPDHALSFYPSSVAFHGGEATPINGPQHAQHQQQTQQPDGGPAYYQGQPRRSHTQDSRPTHSPRRQPLPGVSPLPSPGIAHDSGQSYRTTGQPYQNPDPYAPPSHPPFPKSSAAASTAYPSSSPAVSSSNHYYTPPTAVQNLSATSAPPPDSSMYGSLPPPAQRSAQPPTPHGYGQTPSSAGPQQPGQPYYIPHDQSLLMMEQTTPAPKRKASGFKRVRDPRDLRPSFSPRAPGTAPLPPIRALTTHISQTFNRCNPQFTYEASTNPRRVLTKPSKPAHNEGYDNEDYDYILYVNDLLGTEDGHKYLILDVLGQGTFGQVVKCQNIKTHEIVAVKVVKNKPAYFNQSMMEVTLLEMLNKEHDPDDEHHILRLRDSFIHRNHLCLVFELLSSNLYELIKQNSFSGLSTQLVKVFTAQLLDSLTVLKEARLIHCDLKPENILLKSLQSPQIKVIDFGSACHEKQTVYTYIQSRFYRSPEVLLGVPYTTAIDMWSLGCIAVELFLGLPLFPGTSEYNQITRIVEMLGLPPQFMLDMGKQTNQFFDSFIDNYGTKRYQLKTIEKYSREHNTNEQPGKKYFSHNTLPEIIKNAPIPAQRAKPHEIEKEHNSRLAFIDFVQGLLNLNPMERWTPQQARTHPFITGEKFTGPFVPPGAAGRSGSTPGPAEPERPYGGLIPSQPKGTKAYRDAASYNQHLNQHTAYTQAQAASQQPNTSGAPYRNPYMPPGTLPATSSAQQQQHPAPRADVDPYSSSTGSYSAPTAPPPMPQAQRMPSQSHGSANYSHGGSANAAYSGNAYAHGQQARPRPNGMDIIPPAIARIANMGQDLSGIGRNTLTPVLNRDDGLKEWERRQQQGKQAHNPYPQLEYLQRQAELLPTWNSASRGYIPPQTGNNGHAIGYGAEASVSSNRPGLRDVMTSVRSAAESGTPQQSPSAYAGNSTGGNVRYEAPGAYPPPTATQPSSSHAPYDAFDQRTPSTDMASLYMPMQPTQASSSGNLQGTTRQPSQRQNPSIAQLSSGAGSASSPSAQFYGAGAVPSGVQQQQQRGLYGAASGNASPHIVPGGAPPLALDGRRVNEMDVWPR